MSKTFQRFAIHISATASMREEMLEGRKHLVVPVAMMTEGVHVGSDGPMLHLGAELSATPAVRAWNTKPIVLDHPMLNGSPQSASDPEVFNKQRVGIIFNAHYDSKLRAEAWIDIEKADSIDKRLVANLRAGKMVEVSTGVFTTNEMTPGEWNGEQYLGIARQHEPDHLAVILDGVGACSIMDGAGLLQVNSTTREQLKSIGIDPSHFAARASETFSKLVANAMSHRDTRALLSKALREKFGKGNAEVYVEDVYPEFVVYELAKPGDPPNITLHKLGYALINEGKAVSISDEQPAEVVRLTEYRTVGGSYVGSVGGVTTNQASEEESQSMTKQDLVKRLVANESTIWDESHNEFLMGLDEEKLKKLDAAPQANKEEGDPPADPPADPQANSQPEKQLTLNELIQKAPAEDQEVFAEMKAAHGHQKATLIKTIMANKSNPYTEEELKTKRLHDLRMMAQLASGGQKSEPAAAPVGAYYYGAGSPVPAVHQHQRECPVGLGLPGEDWSDSDKS